MMNSYTVEPRAEFCNSVRGSCPIRFVIDSPIRVSAIVLIYFEFKTGFKIAYFY